jgi:hypothetical protein
MSNEIRDIFLGGDNVWWKDASLDSTGAALTVADACKFSIYASDYPTSEDNGTVVTGADAVSMTFVAGSDGNFVGPLAAGVLVRNTYYWLEVTATPDGGSPHTRRQLCKAVDRDFNP